MANTYVLIASASPSGTNTTTFSSIPQTYTDLFLVVSARSDTASTFTSFQVTVNGDTSAIYSYTRLLGDGANRTTGRFANQNNIVFNYLDASTANANIFGSAEFYFSNYTTSSSKPTSYFGVQEDRISTAYVSTTAGLAQTSSAISSITVNMLAGNYVSGSNLYLYGIKNS